MIVKIGFNSENRPEKPLRLLNDCHRRIERFLYVLITIFRQAQGSVLNDQQRQAFEIALRYFREAAPKHTLDEEESLFPRLRAANFPSTKQMLDRLEILETEHHAVEASHKVVEDLGCLWISRGSLSEQESDRLRGALRKLSSIYHRHIHLEEMEVFPLAEQILSTPEIESVRQEMAARR